MSKFAWGTVIERHRVGPYTLVEYHPFKSDVRAMVDTDVTLYYGVIDGVDQKESWEKLDEALAGLIVRRALGSDHRGVAAHFIAGVRAMSQRRGS